MSIDDQVLAAMGMHDPDDIAAAKAVMDQLDAWKKDHPDTPALNRDNEHLFQQLGAIVLRSMV